jgi:putative ABC transport system permease protein
VIFRFFFFRELKRFPFFFLLLLFTLFLGTIGLIGIKLIAGQVKEQLENNAFNLLTSDFVVSARRDFYPKEKEVLEEKMKGKTTYQVIDVYSMVTHLKNEQTRLVELRGIEKGFPFHGEIKLESGVFDFRGFYISKDLSELWQVKVGEVLQVGGLKLVVKGIVSADTSVGLRGFSLAPRAYLPISEIQRAGLLKPGSTGGFAYHYLLPGMTKPDLLALKRSLYSELRDPAIRVVLPEDSSEQTGRVIQMISNFMSLSALIGLILSLVGVFYLYQSHLQARLKDLCLINLFGFQKKNLILMIVVQFSLLFGFVFLLDLALITPGYKILVPVLSQNLGLDLNPHIKIFPVFSLMPFLYGLSLTILIPLLLGLLRTSMGAQLKAPKLSLGRFRFYDFIPFIVCLWGFSSYLADSQKIGFYFFASLIVVFILSTLIVMGLQKLLKTFVGSRGLLNPSLSAGLAWRGLSRSGHKLTLSFLSITLGATLISLVLQLDRMIQSEFVWDDHKPGLFIFDIQDEQMESFKEFAKKDGTSLEAITPMIRARLSQVNGKKFEKSKASYSVRSAQEDEEDRLRNNALNLTYRDYLTDAEKIVDGTPFPKKRSDPDAPVLVSLEKRWSERAKVKVGDHLTFDVQGVEVEGKVHNIKEIKWTTFYPNFFVTLEPGVIEGAPKTYLAVIPAGDHQSKISFQRKAADAYPNISFIDVEEMIGKLSRLFEKSRQAIEIISYLSLLVGLVILYGLSHDQVYRRIYDLALMKSLGLSSRQIRSNLLIEFGSLFTLAMLLGFFLGWLIAQIIGKEIFKLSLMIDWPRMIYPGVFLLILCCLTILLSSWRIVEAKPRSLLSDG